MRLTQIDDPDELLTKHDREDIIVEEKLDGWKVQIIKSNGEVHLYSRRGDEKTDNFPGLIKSLSLALPDNSMVEGELVYWEKNKQDVGKVTSIAGSSPENAQEKIKDLPGTLKIHLYDVLWNKGQNISDKSFSERRKILQQMVKTDDKVQITKTYPFSDWQKAMQSAVKSGGEGIVLKIKNKPYEYKPAGEKEPKPTDIMYKYKGGGGKEDSDDYVIYDYEISEKDKLKALFGQYYKGKLYHISEISNFSKENEEKIKNKLKSGNFVIEIGFQERQPGGLRHQKFMRFRDDKKPKDATMHEFHAKHIDNFDVAKKNNADDSEKYENLINKLKQILNDAGINPNKITIGGSGIMGALGMKEVGDLDVHVTPEEFEKISNHPDAIIDEIRPGNPRAFFDTDVGEIEIFTGPWIIKEKDFMGKNIPTQKYQGFSHWSPSHVLEYKQLMNRPKDQKDINKLKKHLENEVADRPYIDNTGYIFPADDLMLSKRAALMEDNIIRQLEKLLGIRARPRQLQPVSGLDVNALFKIMSYLESGGKTYAIGDAGTSFGPTQVHGPYFLSRLSRMPNVEPITGLSPDDLRKLSRDWLTSKKLVRRADVWEYVPLDQEEVRRFIIDNPRSVIKRLEGTFVRFRPNMVAVKRGNRYIGKTLNLETLRNFGVDPESPLVKREIEKIFRNYITDNVAKSGIAQLIVLNQNPARFAQFKRRFNRRSIKNDENLSNLIENVSKQDFMSKVNTVLRCLRESNYDTNAPGAFNIYQLMFIANASGAGRVCQFLKNKKLFSRGNLHYIQSNRFKKTLRYLMHKYPELSPVANILLEGLPPNGGRAGFQESKLAFLFSKRANSSEEFVEETTKVFNPKESIFYGAIKTNVYNLITENPFLQEIIQSAFETHYRNKFDTLEVALDRTISDFVRNYMGNLKDTSAAEILAQYFEIFWNIDLKIKAAPAVSREFWEEAKEEWETEEPTKKLATLSKRAQYTEPGVLYFPGSYANDIKEGRRRMTIRANDVPVKVSEIVKCMTYSGGHICDVVITSKERMSLKRIEKAFGKHVAGALEKKFGPNRRFMVIRFDKYEGVNFAEDGDENESKMSEVLIEKDGIKLTRGQIKKHYMKPAIRKKIMSRIKGKPILIYIGVDKNQNILKRNHNGKPIVITNDDPNKDNDPNNYFYWVKRRLLSVHEVFGPKTKIGFVDLDLHGDFSLEKAKKYASELVGKIKNKFNVSPTIYQSGGTGLHVEFKFAEEKNINKLRAELKDMLDKINKDWENVTSSVVKGSGMRTDVSTLHNKGSIRVPGSLGETYGKEKKAISKAQNTDDYPDSMSFGRKYSDTPENLDENPYSLDTGVIKSLPHLSVIPTDGVGSYSIALSKRQIKTAHWRLDPNIDKEYIWFWDSINERLVYYLNYAEGKPSDTYHTHFSLAESVKSPILFSSKDYRGYVYFFNDIPGEGEIHMYSGDPENMPPKLIRELGLLAKDESPEIKEIEVPKGYESNIWKAQEKERQLKEHMEKRRWMGYKEPDPKFIEMLNIKFASAKKKILMLIAPNEFCEPEYTVPRDLFVEKFGFDVITASSSNQAKGNRGTIIQVDKIAEEIDAADYDGFFVVGGKGMVEYSKDKVAQKILKKFVRQKKPIALICHAPLLAVETGVVRGREITGWPEIMGKIRRANGKWTGMPIEKDRMLFTAIGPDDSENLAWVFANFLLNKKTLGPAQEKYLAWKNAVKRIGTIWKVAGILEEELEEELKDLSEEEFMEDPAEAWLKQHDPTYKEEPIEVLKEEPEEKLEEKPEKPEEKSKKLKPPKRTIFEQIEGEIPSIFEKKKKPVDRPKKGPRMEFVEEEELFEDEASFMREIARALSGEPISVEPGEPDEEKKEEPTKEKKEEISETKIEEVVTSEVIEKATSAVNEECETEGSKIIENMLALSPQELIEYIIDEDKEKEIAEEAQKVYNKKLADRIRELAGPAIASSLKPEHLSSQSIQNTIEHMVDKYREKRETKKKELREEFTGRNDADISHGEQFAFDDMVSLSEEERESAKPEFTDRLVPFTDEKGEVLNSWPKIKMPMLPVDAAEYFEPNKIINGIGLRKVFQDERAWDILKKYPQLLQQWILPNVIMAIGYKWFEINSVKEYVGKRAEKEYGVTFRHLQGGAPFSMLEETLSPEQIKKLQEGEIEISDLPGAKEYIQHINKLMPELLNVYLSKENALIPIDSYIYTALNNEMIKIVAEKRDFKQERYPICSICKMESAPEFALQRMERIGRGRWVCPTCKLKVAEIESEMASAQRELRDINGKISRVNKNLTKARSRLEPDLPEEQKLKEIQLIEELQSEQRPLMARRDGVEQEIKGLTQKKHIYEAQTLSVPFFHTLCPNPKCQLRRVPLTAVDWEDSVWGTSKGKNYMKLLEREFGITPPAGMFIEQEADEPTEEELAEVYHIPKKLRISPSRNWILDVPFKCPYDGIRFRMKDVRGQGYRNMAGFFYSPWETTIWEPKGEKEKKKYADDPQYSPENKGPELQELSKISDIAIGGAFKQYYDFYDYLRHMDVAIKSGKKSGEKFEVGTKTYTIPRLSKKQKQVFVRELVLYKTIADFAVGDTQSYLYWLAGSQIVNRPLFIDGKLVRSNVLKKALKYKDRREQIYLPVLQKWIDNMMQFPNYMKKFNLGEWLVQVGEKQTDGTYSKDGIVSDGPGTYFVAKIENDVNEKDYIYGFSCNLESKRKKDAKYKKSFDAKGPRILKILDVWPLESGEINIFGLNPAQKKGMDFVPKKTAEKIIEARERDNLIGDVKSYDFHNVKVDGERSRLAPETFVLVRAFIMPGKHKWTPIEMMRETQQNKREFGFWEKFAELVRAKADNPEYWKKFKEEIEAKKTKGYQLENVIERELLKIKGQSAEDALSTYKKKREFDETPEPKGDAADENKHRFVIQRHKAAKAGEHFDLRLENDDGAMTSWAIPKHKLPKGKEKLLAMKTEDHPISYMKFEGAIPEGEYGAGTVEIYDKGTYDEIEWKKNKIIFKLKGRKEKGRYKIFKTDGDKWMIMEDKKEASFYLSKKMAGVYESIANDLIINGHSNLEKYNLTTDNIYVPDSVKNMLNSELPKNMIVERDGNSLFVRERLVPNYGIEGNWVHVINYSRKPLENILSKLSKLNNEICVSKLPSIADFGEFDDFLAVIFNGPAEAMWNTDVDSNLDPWTGRRTISSEMEKEYIDWNEPDNEAWLIPDKSEIIGIVSNNMDYISQAKALGYKSYLYGPHKLKKDTKFAKLSKRAGHTYTDEEGEWSVDMLIEITDDNKVEELPVSTLEWNMEEKAWGNGKEISPAEVLEKPSKYKEHMERIEEAELKYPILVYKNKLIDGYHRLAKAVSQDKKNIKVKIINDKQMDAARIDKERLKELQISKRATKFTINKEL